VNADDRPLHATLATEILQRLSPTAPVRRQSVEHVAGPPRTAVGGWAGEYVAASGRTTRIAVAEGVATLERRGVVERVRPTGPNSLVAEGQDGAEGEAFLLLDRQGAAGHDSLVHTVDGVVSYRNPSCDPEGEEECFAIDYLGSLATTLVLRHGPGGATLSGSGYFDFPPLALTDHGPGVWSTPLGEVLDLSTSPHRYANIPLRRLDPDRAPVHG